jgi:hypothetical protein
MKILKTIIILLTISFTLQSFSADLMDSKDRRIQFSELGIQYWNEDFCSEYIKPMTIFGFQWKMQNTCFMPYSLQFFNSKDQKMYYYNLNILEFHVSQKSYVKLNFWCYTVDTEGIDNRPEYSFSHKIPLSNAEYKDNNYLSYLYSIPELYTRLVNEEPLKQIILEIDQRVHFWVKEKPSPIKVATSSHIEPLDLYFNRDVNGQFMLPGKVIPLSTIKVLSIKVGTGRYGEPTASKLEKSDEDIWYRLSYFVHIHKT